MRLYEGMKLLLTLLFIPLCLLLSFAPADPVFQDVYFTETNGQLIFGNQRNELRFDAKTGEWVAWAQERSKLSFLTTPSSTSAQINVPLDFSINGDYQIAKYGAKVLSHSISVDKDRRGATLSVTMGVGPTGGSYAYELTSITRLLPMQNGVERSARLTRRKPGEKEHFDGFRFQVPNVAVGDPKSCSITVPGPFFIKTFVAPNTPYDSLSRKEITFHSAPDAGFGLLVMNNAKQRTSLASFMSTGGEVAYRSGIHGDGQHLTFRHDDKRAYYLTPGMTVESDMHHLALGRSQEEVLSAYRQMVTETMPLDIQTPAWVNEQVILEIYPKYFKGGLKEITARLPTYKSIGFTMLYLMPHWTGGYSPMDPYELDPKFGTKADLREMIRVAHSLGLKVIFDMVIHGFNQQSSVPVQRPDLFVRNEQGKLANHPTWGSITTDWANPAYQQYMVDLVLHDQREYDNDGYRVDAATYKGAGWNPNLPYPAYRDGSAAPELMRAMLAALRKKKPDAVLLSEVFGPVFYSVCNFVHDNQTEAVPLLLEKMAKSQYTAADYKAHLTNVFAALPAGANRVFYARNHDTDWFYRFGGYTPRFMAFEAVHALFGIPEAFAGDPDYKFNPDDDPKIYAQYRSLFAFRKRLPVFLRGAMRLGEVNCSNSAVFNGLRGSGSNQSLALISFSDKAETATITLPEGVGHGKPIALQNVFGGEGATLKPTGKSVYEVTLKPFQAVAGGL